MSHRSLLAPSRLGLPSSSSSAEVPCPGCRRHGVFPGRDSAAFARGRSRGVVRFFRTQAGSLGAGVSGHTSLCTACLQARASPTRRRVPQVLTALLLAKAALSEAGGLKPTRKASCLRVCRGFLFVFNILGLLFFFFSNHRGFRPAKKTLVSFSRGALAAASG